MDGGSYNSFEINERLVGAGRFERPTPCAQGKQIDAMSLVRLVWFCVIFRHFACCSRVFGPKSDPLFITRATILLAADGENISRHLHSLRRAESSKAELACVDR